MSMQIPDYAVFAQMPVSARKQSFEMIRRFAAKHSAMLFLQVYQFDPDAEMREMARQELAKQGITPPTEPTPMTVGNGAASRIDGVNIGGGGSFSFTNVATGEAAHSPAAEIDGGNGRPVQRGPQLANVFTLYRRNSKYLTGDRAHLQHNPMAYLLMIGIFILVYAIMWVVFNNVPMSDDEPFSGPQVLILLGVIFGAISLIAILVWIWNIRRDRRYEAEGQLLLGKVTSAHGNWESSSEGGRSFKVTIHGRVRLPDGTILDHRQSHTRGDLAKGGLPRPGDHIAVLAIDRDHVRIL